MPNRALYRMTYMRAGRIHHFTFASRSHERANQFADAWCKNPKNKIEHLQSVEFVRSLQQPLLELEP